MSKKVAQVIIDTLNEAGVEHCYGIVGDTLNAFATSLDPQASSSFTCGTRKPVPSRRRPKRC